MKKGNISRLEGEFWGGGCGNKNYIEGRLGGDDGIIERKGGGELDGRIEFSRNNTVLMEKRERHRCKLNYSLFK